MENFEYIIGIIVLFGSGLACHMITRPKKNISKQNIETNDITLENILKLQKKKGA